MTRLHVAEPRHPEVSQDALDERDELVRKSSRPTPSRPGNALILNVLALLAVIAGLSWFVGGALAVIVTCIAVTIALGVTFGLENAGTAIVAVGMFFAPLSSRQLGTAPPLIMYADVLFLVGFVVLLPVLLPRPLRAPIPFLTGAMLVLSFSLIAIAIQPGLSVSASGALRLTYALIVLPLAFLWWNPSVGRITVLAGSYFVGATADVIYALLIKGPLDDGRYQGATTHPNAFGMSLALALSLVPFLASRLPAMSWFIYAVATLPAYGVWVSGSRSALIGVVMLVLLHLIIERSSGALMLLFAGTALVAASATQAVASGTNGLARLLGTSDSVASNDQRWSHLQDGLDHIANHPILGGGFEQIRVAHNIYVQVGAAIGLVALVGFLLILWSVVTPAFRTTGTLHRLAYPALVYVLIGQINDTLSDTFIWATVALAMLAIPRDGAGKVRVPAEAARRTRAA